MKMDESEIRWQGLAVSTTSLARSCFILFVIFSSSFRNHASASSTASSTLLKMHKFYNNYPPHETSLYDTLGVKSNATMVEITKAYRRKCRDLHPDKRRPVNFDSDSDENTSDDELEKVRDAYEVLKEDSTRLPYHKFGLIDTSLAAMLLTGGKGSNSETPFGDTGNSAYQTISIDQRQLLTWMGYAPHISDHRQRVVFITTNLIETIRPLVEGTVTQEHLAHDIAMQCDKLKVLPLGSQIIRCIGRAYRHTGQAYLDKYALSKNSRQASNNKLDLGSVSSALGIGDKWRKGKDFVSAAVATGKLLYIETKEKRRQMEQQKKQARESSNHMIDYHLQDDFDISMYDEFGSNEGLHSDTEDFALPSTQDEIFESERTKARTALIHTFQIEALWKISKIELDKTIQESCDLLLSGNYFFFPSNYARGGGISRYPNSYNTANYNRERPPDGWVGGSGQIVDADVGKLRAAAALVLIGDILVRCSKEGTSWID